MSAILLPHTRVRPPWWDKVPAKFAHNELLVEAWRSIWLVTWDYPGCSQHFKEELMLDVADTFLPNQFVYNFCLLEILKSRTETP